MKPETTMPEKFLVAHFDSEEELQNWLKKFDNGLNFLQIEKLEDGKIKVNYVFKPVDWSDPEIQRKFFQDVAKGAQPGLEAEQTFLARSTRNAWSSNHVY